MKKSYSIFRIIIVVILITSVTIVFFRCKASHEFRITAARFAAPVVAGPDAGSAHAQDLLIYTAGDVHYPIKASFWMIDATQNGDYNKAEIEIQKPGDPILLEQFYKFYGFTSPVDVDYGLSLEEETAGGKKTLPYTMHIHVNTP
jgi:hypothetical protein